jgi:hypothetical protein
MKYRNRVYLENSIIQRMNSHDIINGDGVLMSCE